MTAHAGVATVVLAPVVGAVLAGLSACSSQTGCTEAGCRSQVTFDLEYGLRPGSPTSSKHASVGDRCRTETLEVPEVREPGVVPVAEVGDLGLQTDRDIVYLALPDQQDWSGTHATTLTIRDAEGDVVTEHQGDATFERFQPNGPNCPRICWRGEVTA